MNKKLIYLNFAILFLLLVGTFYFIFQNQKILSSLAPQQPQPEPNTPQATSSAIQTATVEPTPMPLTTGDTQQAIIKTTNGTDRSKLTPYFNNQVNVSLYATECCQPMSPQDAIEQLSYINEGIPFTFDQKNKDILNLKAKNPQLAVAFVGISQTKEHLLAFTIDELTYKITGIEMSVSWKLYNK